MIKQRLARRLHELAWKLDPPPLNAPLSARIDSPMTDATAGALADILSHDMGHRVGVDYVRVDGSAAHHS